MKRKGTVNKSQFFFYANKRRHQASLYAIRRLEKGLEKECQNTLTATLQTLMLELY